MSRLFSSGAALGALLLSAASLTSLAAFADPATGSTPSPSTATPSGSATQAKDGDHASASDWKARMRADHEAFFAARLASLHAGLQLKPDQEGLWAPVETAIRDLAQARGHGHWQTDTRDDEDRDGKHQDGKSDGSGDVLRMQSARLLRMGNAMKQLANAADPLVASMTPDQKDRLPRLLDGLRPKRILMRAFGVGSDREAGDEGHGRRWRHEAERDGGGRYGDGDHYDGFEHGDGPRDHRGWTAGERDDRDGGREWHHHHHHHHDDGGEQDNDDEPMHS